MHVSKNQAALLDVTEHEIQIARIVAKYKIPTVSEQQKSKYRFLLVLEDGKLQLTEPGTVRYRPICLQPGVLSHLGRRTLMGRAIGRKVQNVVDATAGLGGDTLLMARMGYTVLAVERHPVVAALLENGISQILKKPTEMTIECYFEDAKNLLTRLPKSPDVIYLDPMYPTGRKPSVEVARPIKVLRELVGADTDFDGLFELCLETARKRVVVKRPHFAAPLLKQRLTSSVVGKLVRYDCYLTN